MVSWNAECLLLNSLFRSPPLFDKYYATGGFTNIKGYILESDCKERPNLWAIHLYLLSLEVTLLQNVSILKLASSINTVSIYYSCQHLTRILSKCLSVHPWTPQGVQHICNECSTSWLAHRKLFMWKAVMAAMSAMIRPCPQAPLHEN